MGILRGLACLATALLLVPLVGSPAAADVDIYVTEGTFEVNGRQWRTDCDPYSQTQRCRTEIWATVVAQIDGRFVATNDWYFNNLTYDTSPRRIWEGNPLGATGAWTSDDGRRWRTECDTDLTGRNGCRSFIEASVIESFQNERGGTSYRWATKEVFNSMVRFAPEPVPTPTPDPEPEPLIPPDHLDPASIADAHLRHCLSVAVGVDDGDPLPEVSLSQVTELGCLGVASLADLPDLPALKALFLTGGGLTTLGPITAMTGLEILVIDDNEIDSLAGIGQLSRLTGLGLSDNPVADLGPLASLTDLQNLAADRTGVSDLSPLAGLTGLRYVSVRDAEVASLAPLETLQLRHLDVAGNSISRVAPIVAMTSLRELYVADNPVRDLDSLDAIRASGAFIDIDRATPAP